jgi:hypothetical protein
MSKPLSEAQRLLLATEAIGPAPGWNADLEIPLQGGVILNGDEAADLFARGLLSASPIPPPHEEETNEHSGSITLDHVWHATPAGLTALAETSGEDQVRP